MRWLAGPAIALGALIVALGLAEAVARFLLAERLQPARWPCVYVPDERFGFRYRPGAVERLPGAYAVKINRQGFHDREPLPSELGALRVLAVGDSFTAGLHVPRARTWPQALEDQLRERGLPADVINVGLDGTGSDVHLDLLRAHLPEVRPRVVLLAFFANDVPDVLNGRFTRECYRDVVLSYQSDAQRDALRARIDAHRERRLARWLFERSTLARLWLRASDGERSPFFLPFQQTSAAELGIDDAVRESRRPRLAAVWREIEALAAGCDCRFLVVPVPPRGDLGGSRRAYAEVAGDASLEMLDVVPALRRALRAEGLPESALHFSHDAHLNATGNRLFARAIADAVDWEVLAAQRAGDSAAAASAASASSRAKVDSTR